MADWAGLQLLPETRKKIDVKIPGENRVIYIGVCLLVMVLGLYLYFNSQVQTLEQRLAEIEEQVTSIEEGRDKKKEEKLVDLKKQTALLSKMLSDHIFWSQAWTKLEGLIIPQLQVKSLALSSGKEEIAFAARATSYSAIAKQLATLTNDPAIKDVSISGIRLSPIGGADFDIKLSIDGKEFFKKVSK